MIQTITCLTHEKLYVVVNLFCSSREAWETRNESNSLVKLPDTQADVRRSKRTRVLELPRTQWLINFWRKILDFLNTPALWKNTSWQTCLDGVSTFCNPRSNYKAPRISEGSTIHPLPSTRSFAQLVPSFQLLRSHPFSINEPAEGGIERKSLNFARARLPFFLPYSRFFFLPSGEPLSRHNRRSGPKLSILEINGIIIITSLLFFLSGTMRNRDREGRTFIIFGKINNWSRESDGAKRQRKKPTRKEKKGGVD